MRYRLLPQLLPILACLAAPFVGHADAPPKTTASPPPAAATPATPAGDLRDPRETHFAEIRQLTFGIENAEAYWSFDGKELIFQSTRPPYGCDQIFRIAVDEPRPEPRLVSTGKGRTTCAYFLPGNQRVLYSSSHLGSPACPVPPDHSHGYVWPLLASFDIFTARPDGTDLRPLTSSPGYDAEATVCPRDGSIIFTSTRDGDIDLYRMDADGKNVRRLTKAPGYDGGAFFSSDCQKIVWRASRPKPGPELEDYQKLLQQGLVRPSKLELYVANADGTDARQITYLNAASFAPSFFPSGDRIIFSSNYGDPKGREFDLWAVDVQGTRLERITYTSGFDGFPMFSPDGKRLVFASNRHQGRPGETDIYVARWVDAPVPVTGQGTVPAPPASPASPLSPTSAAERILADVRWLADDAREGRGVGTQGLEQAAAWLEGRFRELGLAPAGDRGGYRQSFMVPVAVRALPETRLVIDGHPVVGADFRPAGFSRSAEAAGTVVVAGHGITAPELKVDDYAGLDARGKVVVVRRFTPEGGAFADEQAQRRYGDLHYKAWNARQHGARAVLIVDVPEVAAGKETPPEAPLPSLVTSGTGAVGDVGIPVAVVRRAASQALVTGRHEVALRVALAVDKKPAFNIVGKIPAGPGSGARHGGREGAVVIGAHYDHLGLGGPGSLAPESHDPHVGADDNASGTATLLEVARSLMERARHATLDRDVYVVAFSGEEVGVLGSTAFVRQAPAGLVAAAVTIPGGLWAMLNMDMVGRLRDNHLAVLGTESAAEWPEMVKAACDRARLDCAMSGDGYGPSDHSPFYAAGVPVLHFFSGAHDDYHKPSDRAERINAAGAAEIAALVEDLAAGVAARPMKLTYRAVPAPPPRGDLRSYGASLGTIPDYAGTPDQKPGVLLAGVRPDGPADTAGLRRGDLLQRIGKYEIRTIEDFEFALRNSRPGEQATITVEREGKPLSVQVIFGQRRF